MVVGRLRHELLRGEADVVKELPLVELVRLSLQFTQFAAQLLDLLGVALLQVGGVHVLVEEGAGVVGDAVARFRGLDASEIAEVSVGTEKKNHEGGNRGLFLF